MELKGVPQNLDNFSGGYSFEAKRDTETLSTPFESCKQDLSFGMCKFSVSHLVSEILAKMWPKSYLRFWADRLLLSFLFIPCKIKCSAMLELISQELVKIKKIYTYQMDDLACSFQMACIRPLYLF